MYETNLGQQGAKRTRYFPSSPDALLRQIIERHPSASKSRLEELFEAAVLKHRGDIEAAVIAYFFTNRFPAITRESESPAERKKRERAQRAALRARTDQVKDAVVATVGRALLEQIAPGCNKALRDMTKEDCQSEGGWYLRIAKALAPQQTVGAAGLTDEQLAALLAGAPKSAGRAPARR